MPKPAVTLQRYRVQTRGGSRFPWTYWYRGEYAGDQLRFTNLGLAKDWAAKAGVRIEVAK